MRWWNRLADIAERVVPELAALLDQCVLFRFEGIAHEVLPHDQARAYLTKLDENFRMPYPAIAIEDPASLVLLFDVEDRQRGVETTRLFAEFMVIDDSGNSDAFNDSLELRLAAEEAARRKAPGSHVLALGNIMFGFNPANRDQWMAKGSLSHLFLGGMIREGATQWLRADDDGKTNVCEAMSVEERIEQFEPIGRNIMAAVEEVLLTPFLPKFRGWPAVPDDPITRRLRRTQQRTVFHIHANGEIERRPPSNQIA